VKGVLSAREANDVLVSGLQLAPGVNTEPVPVADGGEGTADALAMSGEGTSCSYRFGTSSRTSVVGSSDRWSFAQPFNLSRQWGRDRRSWSRLARRRRVLTAAPRAVPVVG
jgi:hypothetical protein